MIRKYLLWIEFFRMNERNFKIAMMRGLSASERVPSPFATGRRRLSSLFTTTGRALMSSWNNEEKKEGDNWVLRMK